MNEERLKVLEMLENGIINAVEAMELLASIDKPKESINVKKVAIAKEGASVNRQTGKFLKIRIDDDGDKVNITLPIAFLKSTLGSSGVTKIIDKSLKNVDNDIKDNIDMETIISCIDSDFLGEIINIDADGSKVLISIE
ncbi:MAG TPA: hypothetical protein VJZ51_06715 [Bacilli bacterium]|nr:hypothetical protein [Bacilli bacterium]